MGETQEVLPLLRQGDSATAACCGRERQRLPEGSKHRPRDARHRHHREHRQQREPRRQAPHHR
eukprot:11602706-Heterocapsa_arctica.AAC.1